MKRQAVIVFILILSCNANRYRNLRWSCNINSCTTSGAKMQNIDTYFDPDPPVVGQLLKISMNGDLSEKVTDGLLYMEVNVNHSPPFKENFDLCYIMSSEMHKPCPLLPGELHYEYSTKIPNLIPPGNYSAMIKATDQNYNELFCLMAKCLITT